MEKHLQFLRATIPKRPTLQTSTLLYKNKPLHAQMLKRKQPTLRILWTHRRQLTFIYKMSKDTTNLDTLPTNTHQTNRENLCTPTQQLLLTLNVENVNKETKKLTLTIIQTMLYEIWETRINLEYENITLTAKTIISKINKHIETVLNSHFKKHKIENTVTLFEESFCINKAIAQLLDGQLKILIPPPQ